MSGTIDDIDRQLLRALFADGRASASDLAEAAGVATSTATKRLAQLEDGGIVAGYQPEVDYEAFGYEVTGSDDVVAIGKFESTEVMNAQIKDLLTHEHVRSASTNIVLNTVREYEHPPVPGESAGAAE